MTDIAIFIFLAYETSRNVTCTAFVEAWQREEPSNRYDAKRAQVFGPRTQLRDRVDKWTKGNARESTCQPHRWRAAHRAHTHTRHNPRGSPWGLTPSVFYYRRTEREKARVDMLYNTYWNHVVGFPWARETSWRERNART